MLILILLTLGLCCLICCGRCALAYIDGVQSTGVGCCVKHFILNDQEYHRGQISVECDERALRELYIPPFKVRSTFGCMFPCFDCDFTNIEGN